MTKGRYASETRVEVEQSEAEIKALLVKYGCRQYGLVYDQDQVAVGFVLGDQAHRIVLPLPTEQDRLTPSHQKQATKSRWRALLLVLKARLEYAELTRQPLAVAFTEYRVLNDGKTVAEHVLGDGGEPPRLTWGT